MSKWANIRQYFAPKAIQTIIEENFQTLIKDKPFKSTIHDIETEDGYNLKAFRIHSESAKPKLRNGKKRPVWLQHGLLDSSDTWMINEDKNCLAYFLANEGYDVWLGNSRGNKYSRAHKKYDLKTEDYWQFSFEQMGRFDLPAISKKILDVTGAEKVSYIGHSQGTSQMFASLCDEKTTEQMNRDLDMFIALGPVVYLANQGDKFLALAVNYNLEQLIKTIRFYELLPGAQRNYFNLFTNLHSRFSKMFPNVSRETFKLIAGSDPKYDNFDRIETFVRHQPSGCSIRCLEHFKQMILEDKKNPRFRKYDFGKEENLKIYGTEVAPEYNLNNIRIPVRAFVGRQDTLGDVTDNEILQARLSALGKDFNMHILEDCGHLTFMWGRDNKNMFEMIAKDLEGSNNVNKKR